MASSVTHGQALLSRLVKQSPDFKNSEMLFSAEQLFLVTHLGCKICVSCPKAEQGTGFVCSAARESNSIPQANPLWKPEALRRAQTVANC